MDHYMGRTKSFEYAPQREDYDSDSSYFAACRRYEAEVKELFKKKSKDANSIRRR